MPNPDDPARAVIAEVLLAADPEETVDHLDALRALQALVAPPVFLDIAARMDVCPVHICDEQICADDDDQTCAEWRDHA